LALFRLLPRIIDVEQNAYAISMFRHVENVFHDGKRSNFKYFNYAVN